MKSQTLCPQTCRKTAYHALVCSTLEYNGIIWDPLLQKDIEKLEKVQRQLQAARFITGDFSSGDQGYVTWMLQELALPSLQHRRKMNRLLLQGALQCHDILTPVHDKRQIKTRQYKDCVTSNIVGRQSTNNTKFLNLCSAIQKLSVMRFSQRQ